MMDVFFYGTLCHAPLRSVVLGHEVGAEPATLADHAVCRARGGAFPLIVPQTGAAAAGVLVRGLTPDDVARLDFYEAGFAFQTRDLPVQANGEVTARVYIADTGRWQTAGVWSLADWQAAHGQTVVATAADVMALYGTRPPETVLSRYGSMLVRGASRVRAAQAAPITRRFAAAAGDVNIAARRHPYADFFAVEEYDLRHRRFDGTLGAQITRAAFVMGDAVTVLPYDPVRDRVLLIEQFRAGPLARGDAQPWLLEAIAGRVDPGETPEDAARREAEEEAGLTLGALVPVAGYYPSPGAVSEYLYSYIALTDLPDGTAGVFGLAGEAEDIRGHLLTFDAAMGLVTSGEINNAPLLLSLLWLQNDRPRLRRHDPATPPT